MNPKHGLQPEAWAKVLAVLPELPPRDSLLVRFLAETGLRRGECSALTVERLRLGADPPRFEVVRGKGGKSRTIFVSPGLASELRGAIGLRVSGPVWVSRKRAGALGGHAVDGIVRRAGALAGVYLHAHMLRHFALTVHQFVTKDIAATAAKAGHSSVTTTARFYIDPWDMAGGKNARDVAAFVANPVLPRAIGDLKNGTV